MIVVSDKLSTESFHAFIDEQLTDEQFEKVERLLDDIPEKIEEIQQCQIINERLREVFDPVVQELLPDELFEIAMNGVSSHVSDAGDYNSEYVDSLDGMSNYYDTQEGEIIPPGGPALSSEDFFDTENDVEEYIDDDIDEFADIEAMSSSDRLEDFDIDAFDAHKEEYGSFPDIFSDGVDNQDSDTPQSGISKQMGEAALQSMESMKLDSIGIADDSKKKNKRFRDRRRKRNHRTVEKDSRKRNVSKQADTSKQQTPSVADVLTENLNLELQDDGSKTSKPEKKSREAAEASLAARKNAEKNETAEVEAKRKQDVIDALSPESELTLEPAATETPEAAKAATEPGNPPPESDKARVAATLESGLELEPQDTKSEQKDAESTPADNSKKQRKNLKQNISAVKKPGMVTAASKKTTAANTQSQQVGKQHTPANFTGEKPAQAAHRANSSGATNVSATNVSATTIGTTGASPNSQVNQEIKKRSAPAASSKATLADEEAFNKIADSINDSLSDSSEKLVKPGSRQGELKGGLKEPFDSIPDKEVVLDYIEEMSFEQQYQEASEFYEDHDREKDFEVSEVVKQFEQSSGQQIPEYQSGFKTSGNQLFDSPLGQIKEKLNFNFDDIKIKAMDYLQNLSSRIKEKIPLKQKGLYDDQYELNQYDEFQQLRQNDEDVLQYNDFQGNDFQGNDFQNSSFQDSVLQDSDLQNNGFQDKEYLDDNFQDTGIPGNQIQEGPGDIENSLEPHNSMDISELQEGIPELTDTKVKSQPATPDEFEEIDEPPTLGGIQMQKTKQQELDEVESFQFSSVRQQQNLRGHRDEKINRSKLENDSLEQIENFKFGIQDEAGMSLEEDEFLQEYSQAILDSEENLAQALPEEYDLPDSLKLQPDFLGQEKPGLLDKMHNLVEPYVEKFRNRQYEAGENIADFEDQQSENVQPTTPSTFVDNIKFAISRKLQELSPENRATVGGLVLMVLGLVVGGAFVSLTGNDTAILSDEVMEQLAIDAHILYNEQDQNFVGSTGASISETFQWLSVRLGRPVTLADVNLSDFKHQKAIIIPTVSNYAAANIYVNKKKQKITLFVSSSLPDVTSSPLICRVPGQVDGLCVWVKNSVLYIAIANLSMSRVRAFSMEVMDKL